MLIASKKISFFYVIVFCMLSIALTFLITSCCIYNKRTNETTTEASAAYCKPELKRLNGFKFVKPLLFVEEDCEADNLSGVKYQINQIINKYKLDQGVTDASVYLRDLNEAEWIAIEPEKEYAPGSLFKLPVLIALLKTEELYPGFLDKTITFSRPIDINKSLAYPPSKFIKLGQNYTARELLKYMISYSDNNATVLLESNMKTDILQKLFTDIGMDAPSIYATQFPLNVKEYSLFLRALYNVGYISIENSEYACQLLSACDFKDGIEKGLPSKVKMIHKFGESGDPNHKELHETAIVYLNNKTYLLTIMTKGKEIKKLSQLLGEISQAVYVEMSNDVDGNAI